MEQQLVESPIAYVYTTLETHDEYFFQFHFSMVWPLDEFEGNLQFHGHRLQPLAIV
jgi:hypothetical protein